MIAVDTNVLVAAHREDAPGHAAALRALRELAESRASWAIPWPCLHEFFSVVTHPRVFAPPSTPEVGIAAVEALVALPQCRLLSETDDHARILSGLISAAPVRGPKVHDARIAAICLGHGVSELWTADRDFSYFPALRTRNPLVGG